MSISCIILIIVGIAAILAILVWGSASIQYSFYLPALCKGKTHKQSVAITFDDGPDPLHTPEVLDVLARYGVRATFFLIGEKAQAHPELVQRIVNEGHLVGNHSYGHKACFPLMSPKGMVKELQATKETIKEITGKQTQLFRPPFGVTNPTVRRAVLRLKLTTIGWSVRSFDTVIRRPRSKVLLRIVRNLKPGAVILLHERCTQSAVLTEKLLKELADRNYSIITLEQMFNIKAYEN